jgi:hypothetical protein
MLGLGANRAPRAVERRSAPVSLEKAAQRLEAGHERARPILPFCDTAARPAEDSISASSRAGIAGAPNHHAGERD